MPYTKSVSAFFFALALAVGITAEADANRIIKSSFYNADKSPLKILDLSASLTNSADGISDYWIDFGALLQSQSDKEIQACEISVKVYDGLGRFLHAFHLIDSDGIQPHEIDNDFIIDNTADSYYHVDFLYKPAWSFINEDGRLAYESVAYISEIRYSDGTDWDNDGPSDSSPLGTSWRHRVFVTH